MDDDRSQVSEKLRVSLLTVGASVLLALAGWAIQIGDELSTAIGHLEKSMAVIQTKLDRLPPPELIQRLDWIQSEADNQRRELERQQTGIERLEIVVREMYGKPLPQRPAYVEGD